MKTLERRLANHEKWTPTDTLVCLGSNPNGQPTTYGYKPTEKDKLKKAKLLALQTDIFKKMADGSWSLPKAGDMLNASKRKSKIFSLIVSDARMKTCGVWTYVYFDSMIFRNNSYKNVAKRIPLVKLYENFLVLPTETSSPPVPV